MDIVCTRCGEAWNTDAVRHEAPEDFTRNGCLILECPLCRGKSVTLSDAQQERLDIVRELACLLGDDLDALAAMLEELD